MTAPSRTRPLGAFVVVLLTIVALHRLGSGPLALPREWSSPALSAWAHEHDPVTIALVLFRLLMLAVAYHLGATTAIGLAGRIMRLPSWVVAAENWTLPPFRSTWGRLAGLGLTAAAAISPQLPAATAASRPTATVRIADPTPDQGDHAALRIVEPGPPSGIATMRVIEAADVPPSETTSAPEAPMPSAQPTVQTHLVAPGDHLWSIAEVHLAEHLGHQPNEAEVAPYWRDLIAANPQVTNPDLIFPGQTLVVPPARS